MKPTNSQAPFAAVFYSEVKNFSGNSSTSGGTSSCCERKRIEGSFYSSENPVIPCTESAVSITILRDTLVYFLIFIVGKNQINPCLLLAVWKCLQQPVRRTEHGNSKKP